MATQVPPPARNPVPGDLVDPKIFKKILENIRSHGTDAPFPLRKMLHATNTSVYTNHFAIKVNPQLPLYQFAIKGFPEEVSNKTKRILVQMMIDATDFLRAHDTEFTTDLRGIVISWVKIPDEALGPVRVSSRENRELIELWLEPRGIVDMDWLQQYAEGKVTINRVSEPPRCATTFL